ncbi:hypothetical protein V6N11_025162 [Hibiscus sabdariffa]|uniref:Protein kinase domain-containing protein n=1 Tax=Hibiscus sabdariffa TaxID=183260 RepID=A0ABR2QP91_9ROSI
MMKTSSLFFFLGGIVVLMILLVIVLIYRKIWRPAGIECFISESRRHEAATDFFSGDLRSIFYFDFRTLKRATKNFHPDNLLGKGGFGPVYKGKLKDGRTVAVKRLSRERSQRGESEFLSEVRLITSIQHKNLVRLLGCCSDGSQRLLVYEFMKNGSLDHIVYGTKELFLNWGTRFFPEDAAYLSTTIAGTLGYTAPEYAIRGELSEKADIYSFGVLVLEIVSCRKNTDLTLPSEMQYLPEYAWKLYERSRMLDLVDPRLRQHGSLVEKDVVRVINVAFFCLQIQPNFRPPMSEIVTMLTCTPEMIGTPTKSLSFDRIRHNKSNDILSSLSWDTMPDPFPSPQTESSPSQVHN